MGSFLMQNAEFYTAKCKMQNAEWLHYSSFRSHGYLIDFDFQMKYDAKGKFFDRTLLKVNDLEKFLLC